MISGNVDTHMGNGISVNPYNSNQRIYWEGKCGNNATVGCWVDVYSEDKKNNIWTDKNFLKTIDHIGKAQLIWVDSRTIKEMQTGVIIKLN